MLHSIRSNNRNFKPVLFHKGFNVVLAERSYDKDNEKKRTRNGAGKTTLIEIIHFCLGAGNRKQSIFNRPELSGWAFSIEIDIAGKMYALERYVDCPNKIYIQGDCAFLGVEIKYDDCLHKYYVSISAFNDFMLGKLYGIEDKKNKPSFRELISYSIRKNVEGYKNPFEFFSHQNKASIQACNAYFLNLSLDYVEEFNDLKLKDRNIKEYKNVLNSGVVSKRSLNIGELNTLVITRKSDMETLKTQLDSFQVYPEYEKLTQQANYITEQLHKVANELILKQRMLDNYLKNLHAEHLNIPLDNIKKTYSEAGILFTKNLLRPLTEVINFHNTIISNRKEYLNGEIISLRSKIAGLKDDMNTLNIERSKIMQILSTHGALQEYVYLQDSYVNAKKLLEDVQEQLNDAQNIEKQSSELKIEKQNLLMKSRQDYDERFQMREKAVSLFKKNTEYLYPEGGTLSIDLNENGYGFRIDIKNSNSQGVNYMKVFCYDLVLLELGKDKKNYPDFLIHDSTIFDGVDERQVSKALMLASTECKENNFQYICLLNSDIIPYQEFGEEFTNEFKSSIVLRLSDKQETGGLLGIRF